MATKKFLEEQRERIARKMGYDGPMSGFRDFVKSDPALEQKLYSIAEKIFNRGGAVLRGFASGGYVTFPKNYAEGGAAALSKEEKSKFIDELYQSILGREADVGGKEYWMQYANPNIKEAFTASAVDELKAKRKQAEDAAAAAKTGVPKTPQAPIVETEDISYATNQSVSSAAAPATATTATPEKVAVTATAAAPVEKKFTPVTAATTATETAKALKELTPAQGTVSKQAQVTAETVEPTKTALAGVKAAEGVARQVEGAPTREEVTGEMVSGPAVDMTRVATELAKTQAAEGVVTKEMTVQGQLNKLLADFDAKQPPPWAAASMRSVTAILAERGLGASSLAGQAIIQATLESALPIATADAATYREMESQNLSNKQQTAMLLAQQRAAFLGQEFDQEFQTRVLNAAKVADIANMNFNAQTQIALENARLAQTMDLANLSNKQAVIMANAAQIANLEMANLNNRQQAAVMNAQAFLQMDMQNLSNEQQMEMFKAQSTIQSIFTDTAVENATRQFNSTGEAQTSQFFAGLSTQVNQFNASQMNAMEEFRVSQANALSTFNATAQNQRDQFNAEFRRIIDQSNAEWRRSIATINTQTENQMAMFNAQNALQVSMAEYNNLWQGYRDDIEMAWKSGESALDRDNQIALQVISKEANIAAAKLQADALKYQALGGAAATILGKTTLGDLLVQGGTKLVSSIIGSDGTAKWSQVGTNPNLFESELGKLEIDAAGNYVLNGKVIWSPEGGDWGG